MQFPPGGWATLFPGCYDQPSLMRFLLFVLCLFFVLPAALWAGSARPVVQEVQTMEWRLGPFPRKDLFSSVPGFKPGTHMSPAKAAQRLAIQTAVLSELLHQQPLAMELVVPGPDGPLHLKLVQTPGAFAPLRWKNDQGSLPGLEQGLHYRGMVAGDAFSLVTLSLYKDEIWGLVSSPHLQNRVLVPVQQPGSSPACMWYNESAYAVPFTCRTLSEKDPADTHPIPGTFTPVPETPTDKCIRVYYEIDFSIYQKNDSSLLQTSHWLAAVHHNTASLYFNEGIRLSVSEVFVWTQPTPFADLDGFAAYRRSFPGDVAAYLSSKMPVGIQGWAGLSIFDPLCVSRHNQEFHSGAYQWAEVPLAFDSLPAFSGTIMVVTHELGHLLGSYHTHNCVWNGNNTQIDDCGNLSPSPFDLNLMACYDSLNPILPPGSSASVMSYCPGALAAGFGPQPAERMRQRINNSPCLGTDCQYSCVPTIDSVRVLENRQNLIRFQVFDSDTSVHQWEYRLVKNAAPDPWISFSTNPFSITGPIPGNPSTYVEVRSLCPAPYSATYQVSSSYFIPYPVLCGTEIYAHGLENNALYLDTSYTEVICPYDSTYRVKMQFQYFQTDFGDTLFLYDGPSVQSPLLGWYEGYASSIPTYLATDASGCLTLDFRANYNGMVALGWRANVSCESVTGLMADSFSEHPLLVFPNPAKQLLRIQLPPSWLGTDLQLTDALGRVRLGWHPTSIWEEKPLPGLPAGMYLLRADGKGPAVKVFVE